MNKPPFGYKTIETKVIGHSGYHRALALDEDEAAIIREIFAIHEGARGEAPLGIKKIVEHLNSKCLCRGKKWRVRKVRKILSDPIFTSICLFGGRTAQGKILF